MEARYIDTLKRGALLANEILREWAAVPGGQSDSSRIGLATSTILHGSIPRIFWLRALIVIQLSSLYHNGVSSVAIETMLDSVFYPSH